MDAAPEGFGWQDEGFTHEETQALSLSTPIHDDTSVSIIHTPILDDLRSRPIYTPLPEGLPNTSVLTKKMMGEYRHVGGHHVHSKKAFEGHVNYDPKKGFSISEKFMDKIGVRHADITTAQRKRFTELARSGRPNTLKEHTRIAIEALVDGGASHEKAKSIVEQSLKNLKKQGVKKPTNIPWNNKR